MQAQDKDHLILGEVEQLSRVFRSAAGKHLGYGLQSLAPKHSFPEVWAAFYQQHPEDLKLLL